MNSPTITLFYRDLRKAVRPRTLLIWIGLALLALFFFSATGAKTKLNTTGQVEFMSIFLPHMIFGSWAVLSSYFDLFSADREHNVLDCILCSNITKRRLFLSKILTIGVTSLFLSLIYLLPISFEIISISGQFKNLLMIAKYILPLWSYIMVYAALGIMISLLARSTKNALITSLAIGLVLMPRFFTLITEGIGNLLSVSPSMISHINMIAPGVMLQSLSELNDVNTFITAILIFTISCLTLLTIAYITFVKQDELGYGE